MPYTKQLIPIHNTGLFSSLFIDYITQSPKVQPFYKHHFSNHNFESFLNEQSFSTVNRVTLTETLTLQALGVKNTHNNTNTNIALLQKTTTYTVTTGHQLCLFTGPLYFIYKIVSAINLCKTLSQKFPDKNFVPVYWMATEDHDLAEINHAHVFGKKIIWETTQKGCAGEFTTEGLKTTIDELKQVLGNSEVYKDTLQLFEEAYVGEANLANATRYIVNALFGQEGLIIIDGNDKALKHLFKKEFEEDAFNQTSFDAVTNTINELNKNYSVQVKPREINSFYKEKGIRERIEKQGNKFIVLNTNLQFTEVEFKTLIATTPEKLSPNVVLRPLYQQKILPNIAYVGGPGEIAYWLEYKNLFETYSIPFPIIIPRQFVMLIDKGIQVKLQKLNLTIEDVFKDGEILVKQLIKTQHSDINLEDYKTALTLIYNSVTDTILSIDKTLVGATEAEKQKTLNGIINLEQKINRALKQKSEADVNQIWIIKEKLFPTNIAQERFDNFSMHLATNHKAFIQNILQQLTYKLDNIEYSVLLA